jgi:diamine N-acetyltransferase
MVVLRLIDDGNFEAAAAIAVRPEQVHLVAGHEPVAILILAKSQVGRWGLRWEPLAIHAQGKLVGVVGLAFVPDGKEARFFHLAIDASEQGNGWGRAAVSALAERAKARGSEILSLTVHPDNERARQVYVSAGFVTTGQEVEGEALMTLLL